MGWPQAQRPAKLSHETSEFLGVGESWSPSKSGVPGLSAYPRLLQDWWVPCKSWGLRALLKVWIFFGDMLFLGSWLVWFQVKAASDSQTKVAAFKELQALRLLPTCRWVGVKWVICGFLIEGGFFSRWKLDGVPWQWGFWTHFAQHWLVASAMLQVECLSLVASAAYSLNAESQDPQQFGNTFEKASDNCWILQSLWIASGQQEIRVPSAWGHSDAPSSAVQHRWARSYCRCSCQ